MGSPFVTDEYARAFEAGALAALEYIDQEWPDLAEPHDDFPGVTAATAEHIGRVIDLMLGRSPASAPTDQSTGKDVTHD